VPVSGSVRVSIKTLVYQSIEHWELFIYVPYNLVGIVRFLFIILDINIIMVQ